MRTLEECKQEIAKKHGQDSWWNFIWNHFSGDLTPRAINLLWEEVCELYAEQFRKTQSHEPSCREKGC